MRGRGSSGHPRSQQLRRCLVGSEKLLRGRVPAVRMRIYAPFALAVRHRLLRGVSGRRVLEPAVLLRARLRVIALASRTTGFLALILKPDLDFPCTQPDGTPDFFAHCCGGKPGLGQESMKDGGLVGGRERPRPLFLERGDGRRGRLQVWTPAAGLFCVRHAALRVGGPRAGRVFWGVAAHSFSHWGAVGGGSSVD